MTAKEFFGPGIDENKIQNCKFLFQDFVFFTNIKTTFHFPFQGPLTLGALAQV